MNFSTLSNIVNNVKFFRKPVEIHKLTVDVSKRDENFLKDFLRDFYRKIIDTKDFNTFEKNLTRWIKNIDKKDIESIFKF